MSKPIALPTVAATAAFLSASAACAGQFCASPNAAGIRLCSIDQSVNPAALCNDKSTPKFWIHQGSGTGNNRWLFWLQGGGDCVDIPSCTMRAHSSAAKNNQLLTSNGYTAPASGGAGILSADPAVNPILYNANIVLVHYCSSDSWSGGYSTSAKFNRNDPTSWVFQGRAIALAAIATLQESNLGFSDARQILLGGSSSGGQGITIIANDIVPLIKSSAEIGMINDAGYALNIGAYDPLVPSPYVQPGRPTAFDLKFASGLRLWHGRGDVVCDSSAQTFWDHVSCYDSALILREGYVTLPSFVAESQLDTAQLNQELCPLTYGAGCRPPCAPTMQADYAASFAQDMRQTLADKTTVNPYSVFSPNQYAHEILNNTASFSAEIHFARHQTLTPAAALDAWLRAPATRTVNLANQPGIPACK